MQSNFGKGVLGVALVVAAVVLFIVLSDSGDDGGDDTTTATTTEATTTGENGQQPPETPEQPEQPQQPQIPVITVKSGAPVGGVEEIDVTSGERIRFTVASDEEGEVHVHGYDITEDVAAGGTVTLSFPADLQGGYEVELHSHESGGEFQIAELTVNPG